MATDEITDKSMEWASVILWIEEYPPLFDFPVWYGIEENRLVVVDAAMERIDPTWQYGLFTTDGLERFVITPQPPPVEVHSPS